MLIRLVRPAARLLMGSTFAVLGFEAFQSPGARVAMAGPLIAGIRRAIPLPASDTAIVRSNGAAQGIGGTLLALGVLPRTSALVVAASLVPTTIAGHAFWSADDPELRKLQRIHFQKNMAMLGGLLLAFADAHHAHISSPDHNPARGKR